MITAMKKISIFVFTIFIASCSLTPGIHISENVGNSVYVESIDKNIPIEKLETYITDEAIDVSYKIGNGDQISITVWGLPEIFPMVNISPDQNLRRVDSKGDIYYPYVGLIKARLKTQNELRDDVKEKLSNFFNDPQVDVSIARFNSQKVYLLGEVYLPQKLNLTDIPLSLSDALGEVKGLNNNTSDSGKVFIIRQGNDTESPVIILADLSTPAGFINSSKFYLKDNDIVYVNAKGTTRWNRVISQFFPFTTFLNTVDNLTED